MDGDKSQDENANEDHFRLGTQELGTHNNIMSRLVQTDFFWIHNIRFRFEKLGTQLS